MKESGILRGRDRRTGDFVEKMVAAVVGIEISITVLK
jgi:hypothetical protein